jgi:hypothetical protein
VIPASMRSDSQGLVNRAAVVTGELNGIGGLRIPPFFPECICDVSRNARVKAADLQNRSALLPSGS